jgi:hypothetical protein
MIFRRCLLLLVAASAVSAAQSKHSWAKVHQQDEAKWAQQTGLDPFVVHQLWRKASQVAKASDDDSRIQLLDAAHLGRDHILLVTYAGADYCLNLTVFVQTKGYPKIWTQQRTPEGTGFCGGDVKVWAQAGTIVVSMPARSGGADVLTNYSYEWNGETYRFTEQR